jgi:hypothetical protein
MNGLIPSDAKLTVTLQAQHWQAALTWIGKQPYEVVAPLIQMIMQQLEAQGDSTAPGNGVDAQPLQFSGPHA